MGGRWWGRERDREGERERSGKNTGGAVGRGKGGGKAGGGGRLRTRSMKEEGEGVRDFNMNAGLLFGSYLKVDSRDRVPAPKEVQAGGVLWTTLGHLHC